MEFKIGNMVRLKSGGPKMIVNYISDAGKPPDLICTCLWFDGSEYKEGYFNSKVLELYEDDNVKIIEPKKLYFWVKYNWKTKIAKYTSYTDPNPDISFYDNLDQDETLHRCEVSLTPTIGSTQDFVRAKELHNESDKILPEEVSARNIMSRIYCYKIVPVLPRENILVGDKILINSEKNMVSKIDILENNKTLRSFEISVREI